MKTKIVLWGKNAEGQKKLIALQLKPDTNEVSRWVFDDAPTMGEFYSLLMDEWRTDKEVAFPQEGFAFDTFELTASGNFLPQGITPDKEDILQRAQTEWHFAVLSSRLHQSYQAELNDIKDRVTATDEYDQASWDELKVFWDKIREQMRDRNLFKEHADQLKEQINELFITMKARKEVMDAKYQRVATEKFETFMSILTNIENRIQGNVNFHRIFDELKNVQKDIKDLQLNKEQRKELWDRLDVVFKEVKEKRFGVDAAGEPGGANPANRIDRRYQGLLSAIARMEDSIHRDQEDLKFQNKKIDSVHAGQLETQIRQAKIVMIQERIRSKEEKLEDMLKTKAELESRNKPKQKAKGGAEEEANDATATFAIGETIPEILPADDQQA